MERGGIYTWWHYFKQGKTSGQVATLITLTIAVIFLFVAVTINIGRVAQKKTVTANAADGAAMKLASYIGSYSNKLSLEFLKGRAKTKWKRNWSGFWSLAAAVVLAVIAFNPGIIAGLIGAEAATVGTLAAIGAGISGAVYGIKVGVLPGKVAHRLQRQLNKLKIEDRLTEQAILYALSNAVDDPTKVVDVHDYDEDGDTTDKIPRFAKWYAERLKALAEEAEESKSSLSAKIADFLPVMEEFARKGERFRQEFTEDATRPLIIDDPERDPDAKIPAGQDGELVILLQELRELGIEVSFWRPGADTRENVDSVDALSTDLNGFYLWALGEKGGLLNQEFAMVVQMYEMWIPQLYNPEEEGDWYDRWEEDIQNIDNWRSQLYGVIRQLEELLAAEPEPEEPEEPEEPQPPSRREYLLSLKERVYAAISQLNDFQEDLRDFNTEIVTFYLQSEEDTYVHKNQATYSWHDTTGWHHVRVQVSEFALPRIKVQKKNRWYGYKIRLVLVDHSGEVTVRVTRYDQASSEGFFARGKAVPLWRFRYTRDAQAGERIDPANPEAALQYGITSVGTARYSYRDLPRIVRVQ